MESKRVFSWLNWLRNGSQYDRVGVHPRYKEVCGEKNIPIGSMYGVFAYIYHANQPNVGKYSIHGSYGMVFFWGGRVSILVESRVASS